jgi:hypothetical protein
MKKELLVASALVTSLGMAGVAEAASATFSGKVRNGVTGGDTDGTADGTYAAHSQASFTVSLAETLDSGTKVSTGFDLTDESDGATDTSGLTLTFTDGSKLDLLEAGNAYSSKLASVPSASGEHGLTGTTLNSAPTGLTFGNTSDNIGFEWHSADDAFGVEGLKVGVSAGFGDDGDTSSTSTAENSYSVGLSYATTTGDTTITVGGGYMMAEDSNTTTVNDRANQTAVAVTAATGDLTVGVGFAAGSYVDANSGASAEVDGAEAISAGVKYVSGDITFAVGYVDGEAKDNTSFSGAGSNQDSYESMSASVDYVVISGITATVSYATEDAAEEGTSSTNHSGSSWYVGANVTF